MKASKKTVIIGVVVVLAVTFLLAYLFPVNLVVNKNAGLMGLFHGVLVVPNGIIHLFKNSWHYIAKMHPDAYNVGWWIGIVLNIVFYAGAIWTIIKKK